MPFTSHFVLSLSPTWPCSLFRSYLLNPVTQLDFTPASSTNMHQLELLTRIFLNVSLSSPSTWLPLLFPEAHCSGMVRIQTDELLRGKKILLHNNRVNLFNIEKDNMKKLRSSNDDWINQPFTKIQYMYN